MPSLQAAIDCAESHRRARFHDPEAVFIVSDETGQQVDETLCAVALTATSEPSRPNGPGLANTFPRAYSARIRDARQQLAQALTELPSVQGSAAIARADAAFELLTLAEHEMERYERLAQLEGRED
jgi:hypothetical protein